MRLNGDSRGDFLMRLAATDISVPLVIEGRTKAQVERWSVFRLLATLARCGKLAYPLEVCSGDRPDYTVSVPFGTIGIEVTEAIPRNWAWANAHREKRCHENEVMLERFAPGEALRGSVEIEKIAQGQKTGSIWEGDSVEQEYAGAMLHFALEKKNAFGKSGFKNCDCNWLVIYNQWPLPRLDEFIGATHFSRRLGNLDGPLPFNKVFVECSENFWEFSQGSITSFRINDIWEGR